MKDFIYTNKRNLCPICNKDHGCRIFNNDKVHCLRVTHPSEAPTGWRYLGELRGGMGASLILEANSYRYDRSKAHLEREALQKAQQKLNSLSIEERDKAIRDLHKRQGLIFEDRRHLKEVRGLTDEQIAKNLYFSLTPNQDLPYGFPINFPGVSPNGKNLNNKYRAIACVTFNPQGLATGLQIRLTGEVEGGRYRWLSGTHSSHLPNGELPLTYIAPSTLTSACIGLVEGTGIKPQIAADKLGETVIGAAGGQHATSPKQLKEFLEEAQKEIKKTFPDASPSTLRLYLDAGDVNNKHVTQRVNNLIAFLTKLGYKVEIAWWVQTTKEDDDIDELSDVSLIEYVPYKQFDLLKTPRDKDESTTTINEPEPEIIDYRSTLELLNKSLVVVEKLEDYEGELEEKVVVLGDKTPMDWLKQNCQELWQLEKIYLGLADNNEALKLAYEIKKLGQKIKVFFLENEIPLAIALKQAIPMAVMEIKQGKKLTKPNEKITSKYLGKINRDFPDQDIFLAVSMGKGKTTSIAQEVKENRALGIGTNAFTHRESLSRILGTILGLCYRTDLKDQPDALLKEGFSACMENAHKNANPPFMPHVHFNKNLVIDEVRQGVLSLLFSDTFKNNRVSVLKAIREGVHGMKITGRNLTLSDADLDDLTIDFLVEWLNLNLEKIKIITDNRDESEKGDFYNVGSVDALCAAALNFAAQGKRFIFMTSAQQAQYKTSSQTLETSFRGKFPDKKVVRFDSETIHDPNHVAYQLIKDIQRIHEFDIVIMTSILETGISIEEPEDKSRKFDAIFGIANGVQLPEAFSQGLGRPRYDVPAFGCIAKKGKFEMAGGSIYPSEINYRFNKQINAIYAEFDDFIERCDEETTEVKRIARKFIEKFICLRNYQAKNYKACVLEQIAKSRNIRQYVATDHLEVPMKDEDELEAKETLETLEESDLAQGSETLEEKPSLPTYFYALDAKHITKEARDLNYSFKCESVSNIANPTDTVFNKQDRQRDLTQNQRFEQDKGVICRIYGMNSEEVTRDVIEFHDEHSSSELRNRYFSTEGFKACKSKITKSALNPAKIREIKRLDAIYSEAYGHLLPTDLIPKIQFFMFKTLNQLRLDRVPLSGKKSDLTKWIKTNVLPLKREIEDWLGIKFSQEEKYLERLQAVFEKVGFKLALRVKGEPENYLITDEIPPILVNSYYKKLRLEEEKRPEKELIEIEKATNLINKICDFAKSYGKKITSDFWEFAIKYRYKADYVLDKLVSMLFSEDFKNNTFDREEIDQRINEALGFDFKNFLSKIFRYGLEKNTNEVLHTFEKTEKCESLEPLQGMASEKNNFPNNILLEESLTDEIICNRDEVVDYYEISNSNPDLEGLEFPKCEDRVTENTRKTTIIQNNPHTQKPPSKTNEERIATLLGSLKLGVKVAISTAKGWLEGAVRLVGCAYTVIAVDDPSYDGSDGMLNLSSDFLARQPWNLDRIRILS